MSAHHALVRLLEAARCATLVLLAGKAVLVGRVAVLRLQE